MRTQLGSYPVVLFDRHGTQTLKPTHIFPICWMKSKTPGMGMLKVDAVGPVILNKLVEVRMWYG